MKKNILIGCLTVITLALAVLVVLMYTGKINLKKGECPPATCKECDIVVTPATENNNVDNTVNTRTITREYEVTMNGNKKIISVKFEVRKSEEDENKFIIAGYFGEECIVYADYQNIKNINDAIDNLFNNNNIEVVSGEDLKDYLVITTILFDPTGFYSFYNIYNQDNKKIDDLLLYFGGETVWFKDKVNHWYGDKHDMCKYDEPNCQVRAKIENNKIYSLEEIECANGGGEEGYFYKYIYTINNNSLIKSDVINTYITNDTAGRCSN